MKRLLAVGAVSLGLGLAGATGAEPPSEDTCPTVRGGPGAAGSEDAMLLPLKEGSVLGHGDLMALESLLPDEVWVHRRVFFHEGMRLEIGPCHRRYPTPEFWQQATATNAEKVKLDKEGNLRGYVAGEPFPPASIDPSAKDAGARWAWNLEYRWRGAGPVGDFRLVDMPSRLGKPQTYKGEFFHVQTERRADLAASDYRASVGEDYMWVAGGVFTEPFDARHLAWRQMRPLDAERNDRAQDTTFVYVPSMRKPRRAATAWVDGVYTPRYRVSSPEGGGGVPFGSNQYGPTGSIAPTAGISASASEHIRRGFVGQALRPNAYQWKLLGEREVLAPLNGVREGYPINPDRNFGEHGLSVGSDRWDVRWAVVIQGIPHRKDSEVAALTLYLDYLTHQPLYYIARRSNGLLLDVGIFVHWFSGDIPHYPEWPGGNKANVFDPVASVFYSVAEGGTGWRRESYEVRSVPVDDSRLREMTSTSPLLRGR